MKTDKKNYWAKLNNLHLLTNSLSLSHHSPKSLSLSLSATRVMRKALTRSVNPSLVKTVTTSQKCYYSSGAVATAASEPESDSSFTFSPDATNNQNTTTIGDNIFLKPIKKKSSSSSVTMPLSFMTGSIVGKRFYKQVTTREADDGNGWTVMLDYRTLKTPSKRPLKCPTITLAKAIAAEWDYQVLFLFLYIDINCLRLFNCDSN